MLVYQDFLSKREMKPVKRSKKKVWQIQNNGKIDPSIADEVETMPTDILISYMWERAIMLFRGLLYFRKPCFIGNILSGQFN